MSKFITDKEIAFIGKITKELIQKVVGQSVTYFAILADKTQKNDLYNEAVKKVWAPPVQCNALVYYENTTEQVTALPADAKFKIDVYFHQLELKERRLEPRMGDFLKFGDIAYEILSVTKPQITFGLIDEKVMVRCPCSPAREGQFNPPPPPAPPKPGPSDALPLDFPIDLQ